MKIILFCLATLPVFAQHKHPAVKTSVVAQRITSDMSPEKRADEQTKALTAQLDLNPKQVVQVQAFALTSTRALQAMMRRHEAGDWSGPDAFEESRAINQQFETNLASICTPAQKQKRQRTLALFRPIVTHYDSLNRARKAQR
ncbi:MAG: hypothetical protein ACRYFX_32000 [Janthinobacterium lividum]